MILCRNVKPDKEMLPPCSLRACIADDGVFDAGHARCVKLHIDLKLKLHKMLNKDRLPELKIISEMLQKKYGSSPIFGNAMLGADYLIELVFK